MGFHKICIGIGMGKWLRPTITVRLYGSSVPCFVADGLARRNSYAISYKENRGWSGFEKNQKRGKHFSSILLFREKTLQPRDAILNETLHSPAPATQLNLTIPYNDTEVADQHLNTKQEALANERHAHRERHQPSTTSASYGHVYFQLVSM